MAEEEQPDPLAGILATARRVVRLCYLRPLLKDSKVEPFMMEEEEIDSMLEPYERNIESDMQVLEECLRAATGLGSGGHPQPLTDEISLSGNQDKDNA